MRYAAAIFLRKKDAIAIPVCSREKLTLIQFFLIPCSVIENN